MGVWFVDVRSSRRSDVGDVGRRLCGEQLLGDAFNSGGSVALVELHLLLLRGARNGRPVAPPPQVCAHQQRDDRRVEHHDHLPKINIWLFRYLTNFLTKI